MEMLTPEAELILEAADRKLRRMKRVEFDRLAAEGCFDDEKVELLFGMVVEMAPIDPAHDESCERVHDMLRRQVGDRARVRNQGSFDASDDSVPLPDVYVMPHGDYWRERPSHALLVIEVARSSLRRDRAKRFVYGIADVDEYWIVNHTQRCVEVFRDRRDGVWQATSIHRSGEILSPLAFPDVKIPVDEILPPA